MEMRLLLPLLELKCVWMCLRELEVIAFIRLSEGGYGRWRVEKKKKNEADEKDGELREFSLLKWRGYESVFGEWGVNEIKCEWMCLGGVWPLVSLRV